MVLKLKNIETTSETLKEARVNVKKMSLAKDIIIFLALYLIIIFSPLIPQIILGDIIESESPISQIIELLTLIAPILVIFLIVLKLEKRNLRSIGISKDNVIPSLLKGLSIGFLMF
jgi:cytochrome c biogenesis protein CcdA